jgi:hypothetical protein
MPSLETVCEILGTCARKLRSGPQVALDHSERQEYFGDGRRREVSLLHGGYVSWNTNHN